MVAIKEIPNKVEVDDLETSTLIEKYFKPEVYQSKDMHDCIL